MTLPCIESAQSRFASNARHRETRTRSTVFTVTRPCFPNRRILLSTAVLAMLLSFLNHAHAIDPPTRLEPPNAPPVIVGFFATNSEMGWTFEGQVSDEHATGLVITFGGLLAGHQTTVQNSSGYFQYTVQIQGPGTVTAHTVDDHQQGSNYVFYYIQ